ncbi:MAG: Ig-like domain repeat protein [Solirubrobacteraceae bacterium]|nr:Ig-like domain repeat protein [Solirubrobacteraceae bacterium]
MRRSSTMLLLAGAVGVAALAAPGAAMADGCPSEQSVLPYSKRNPPYQCASSRHSGKKSIGSWDTKSWTQNTALGYSVKSHCYYRSDKDVSVTEAWASASYTATATNWDTGGTRHWAAGVLFTTGDVDGSSYSNGCDSHGGISTSIQRITSLSLKAGTPSGDTFTFTASISPSDAKGAAVLRANGQPVAQAPFSSGKATLTFRPPAPGSYQVDAVYQGDTSACPSRSESCGWTPASSKVIQVVLSGATATATETDAVSPDAVTVTDAGPSPDEPATDTSGTSVSSTSGDTAADAARATAAAAGIAEVRDSTFGLTTQTRTRRMPAALRLRCPQGSVLMHAETLAESAAARVKVAEGLHGARVVPTPGARGKEVALQVTCRRAGVPRLVAKGLGYGTERADRLTTQMSGGTLFGGPGADHLAVRHRAGVAYGGLGDDVIHVAGTDGVAKGGPGDDRLVARGSGRVLLVGGPGHDTFVAGARHTIVNAADGQRDRIVCTSRHARVLADRHDVVTGSCTVRR